MNDTLRVRRGERTRHVSENRDRVIERHRPALNSLAERRALDPRHRVVRHAVRIAGRQQRNDVRVLKSSGRADLALEPLNGVLRHDVGGQCLDDDVSSEPAICREIDAGHAATTKLTLELVGRVECGGETFERGVGQAARMRGGENGGVAKNVVPRTGTRQTATAFQSARSATIGSTRNARRAGMSAASNATPVTTASTTMNTNGSRGDV